MIVTMADARAAKMCSRGVRLFLRRHGYDWFDFVKNGIEEEKLLATNDVMAMKVVEIARVRRQ